MTWRHRFTFMQAVGLCFATTLSVHAVYAQSSGTQALPRTTIVASPLSDESAAELAGKAVVSREELIRYGDTSIADVLRRQPGVTINSLPSGEREVRIRGLGSGYVRILLNGQPVPAGFSLDSLSPGGVERIEIIRLGTADSGSQAIGGTINIVLQAPDPKRRPELKIAVAHLESLWLPRVEYSQSFAAKPLAGALNFSLLREAVVPRHDARETAASNGVPVYEYLGADAGVYTFTTLTLAPKLEFSEGQDKVGAEVFARVRRTSGYAIERIQPIFGVPPPYVSSDSDSSSTNSSISTRLNWVRKFDGGGSSELKIGRSQNVIRSDFDITSKDSFGRPNLDRAIDSSIRETVDQVAAKFKAPLTSEHALAIGADVERSHRADSRLQVDAALALTPEIATNESYRLSVAALSFYAQDEIELSARTSLYVGVRHEAIDIRGAGTAFAVLSNRAKVWSPSFQFVHKPEHAPNDLLRLAISRTYRAPRLSELSPQRFSNNNNSPTFPDRQGNPGLHPELAWAADLSYEKALGDGAKLTSTLFLKRISDIIVPVLSLEDGLWIRRPMNAGTAAMRGIELDLRVPKKKMPSLLKALDVRLSASRNWSHIDSISGPDNRIPTQSELLGSFTADYTYSGDLSLGGSFTFDRGGPVTRSVLLRELLPIRRTLDMYALWRIGPSASLRLSATNLLASKQYSNATFSDGTTTTFRDLSTHTFRTLRLTLETRL